jgi:hypothetical protein
MRLGTPFCITVDHQTLEDQTVTIRHRDTMKQHFEKVYQYSWGFDFVFFGFMFNPKR